MNHQVEHLFLLSVSDCFSNKQNISKEIKSYFRQYQINFQQEINQKNINIYMNHLNQIHHYPLENVTMFYLHKNSKCVQHIYIHTHIPKSYLFFKVSYLKGRTIERQTDRLISRSSILGLLPKWPQWLIWARPKPGTKIPSRPFKCIQESRFQPSALFPGALERSCTGSRVARTQKWCSDAILALWMAA